MKILLNQSSRQATVKLNILKFYKKKNLIYYTESNLPVKAE
jgi:hypothetical protein